MPEDTDRAIVEAHGIPAEILGAPPAGRSSLDPGAAERAWDLLLDELWTHMMRRCLGSLIIFFLRVRIVQLEEIAGAVVPGRDSNPLRGDQPAAPCSGQPRGSIADD
jgi:hypothetical protein